MAKTKFDIKTVQTEATRSAQRAFHAGVGVTDLAVGVVRDVVETTQKRVADVQKSVTTFEPRSLGKSLTQDAKARRTAIEKRVADLQSEAMAVPSRVQQAVDANVATASETYDELVKRGRSLVGRIRRQQSTQDALAAAETTVAKARTTRTQAGVAAKKANTAAKRSAAARKTAAEKADTAAKRSAAARKTAAEKRIAPVRSSAKATRTSAKKTVSAASRALTDAAAKVGD